MTRASFNAMFRAMFRGMRTGGLLTLLTLFYLLPAAAQTREAQNQWAWWGTWNQDLSEAIRADNPARYKRVTLRITPWEDGLKVTYDMVGLRGGVTHVEWVGRFDGKDYPVRGLGYLLTNAYSLVDTQGYRITLKRDGQLAATAVVSVSPDGKTLRVVTTERNAQGQEVQTTTAYSKH